MSYDHGALESALAQAVGQDEDLVAQLRDAFGDSARRQIDLMQRARCDANWLYAALRLKGIAASFGASQIQALAEEAADGAPGDPVVLRELTMAVNSAVDPA